MRGAAGTGDVAEGVETLRAVARRSRWIVGLLIVLGIVAMNTVQRLRGPEYRATARVVLSATDPGSSVTGVGVVDPELVDQSDEALARSPQLFARVSAAMGRSFGSASELRDATDVSKDDTVLKFDVTGEDRRRATAAANVLASTYPTWRAQVAGRAIDRAIAQLERAPRKDPGLVEQLTRLRVLKTLTAGNVLVVERARPAKKVRPDLVLDSLLGAFIGLFVALLVVAVREALDTKVRSEEEVEELLDAPVIGTVDRLPRRAPLVAFQGPRAPFAQAYALVASKLGQAHPETGTLVIAVTSALANEGKTVTASNLAGALARRGSDVLLVDLDNERSALAGLFEIPESAPGVDRVVERQADLAGLLWTVSPNGASPTALPPLDDGADEQAIGVVRILPAGPRADNSAVIDADRVRKAVQHLSEGRSYVVLDMPPALSTPHATEVAKIVDVVLIVVRHGHVSRRSLRALRRLERDWPDVRRAAVMVGAPGAQEVYGQYAMR